MLTATADARRKKPKAGKITDGVYVDAKYNFQLTMLEGWDVSVQKDENNVRLSFKQKDYGIPGHFINAPDYTKIPRIVVYVDTATPGVHPFLDSLLAEEFKSDQKKAILKEFDILQYSDISDGPVITKGRSRLELGGESGVLWRGQAKYKQNVAYSASSAGGRTVRGSYGGAIVLVKRDNHLYMFHIVCEWSFFDAVLADAMKIIGSFAWTDLESEGE